MNRNLVSPSGGVTVVQTLKLYEGGTGAVDGPGALANMGAVPKSLIDQPNGVAGLDASSKMNVNVLPADKVSLVSLDGPASMNKGTSAVFTISNFDVFANYTLEAVGGTISRTKDKILYTAPTAIGNSGFKINGRLVSISVTDYKPNKPTLTGVVSSGSGNTPALVLTASAFAMPGSSDTHKNTDWQIATDAAFTSFLNQSLADTVNKTGFTGSPGALNTVYYARCRYRSSGDYVSDWSDTFVIRTAANYLPTRETQKVVPPDRQTNMTFGFSVSVSADGTRMAVCAPFNVDGSQAGACYIFVRINGVWLVEQKLSNPVTSVSLNDRLGYHCGMDQTGTRVVVSAYRDDFTINSTTYTDAGSAWVFARTGTLWVLEGTLRSDAPSTNNWFGVGCGISWDGTRAVVCAQQNGGGAWVYVRSGTTWALEQRLVQATAAPGTAFYGVACSISPDGTRVGVNDYNYDGVNGGALYVFRRDGTVWSQEQVVRAADTPTQANFGTSSYFTQDCSRLIVGCNADDTSFTNAGSAYIFTRSGTTWTQEAKIVASNRKAGDSFGFVRISADGNRALVGAAGAGGIGSPNTTTGAVYIYARAGSTWSQVAVITGSDNVNGVNFGSSVGVSADLSVVVSAAQFQDSSGAVYSFSA